MIYYPLQLLQLAGIREVLVVTGKGHAGQMIDLLGDGRLTARGTDEPLLELDLTYKVQTEAGGIAQVVGMAREFAAGDPLVVVLGDNIFEHAHADEIRGWAADGAGARIFVKEVPDPRTSASSSTARTVASPTSSRRPASSTCATTRRRPRTRSSASTATRRRLRRDPRPAAVEPRRARDHRREPPLRERGDLGVVEVRGWWEDAGKHWQHLAEIGRTIEETGANK